MSADLRRAIPSWLLLLAAAGCGPAAAETQSATASFTSTQVLFFPVSVDPIPSVSASARLDFKLNIEKMIFLRVGTGGNHSGGASGAGPAASGSVSTVTLNLTPSIPSGATAPLPGSNQSVGWNAGAPTFLAAAPVVLPVEVRSNAGQVKITGQVTAPLSNGTDTIPMSSVSITSSDSANLPAPVLPNVGTAAPVTVSPGGTGTGAAPTLLTYRTANWSFGFTPTASLPPGTYSGSVTFTATAL